MISICFSELASNKLKLSIIGHSSTDKGNDIVCSAVSALTQTFVRGIEKNLKARFKGEFLSGKCNLSIEVPEENSEKFKIICDIFKDGFSKISESYPEQVKMN
jgi:uncharacterized protein YsxB (DUF464 family)